MRSFRWVPAVSSSLREESGQALILLALSLVVLCGFLGLAIDVGQARATQRKLQEAADAAALAGALEVQQCNGASNCGEMQTAAQAALGENGLTGSTLQSQVCSVGSSTNLTLTVNNGPCALGSRDPNYNNVQYVEAVVTEAQPATFAGILGIKTFNLSARSEAGLTVRNCIFTTNPSASDAFLVKGSSTLSASCGAVDDSSSSWALVVQDSASTLETTSLTVHGDYTNKGTMQPATPATNAPSVPDPLAYLPTQTQPSTATCNAQPDPSTVANNVYSGASSQVKVNNKATATFYPGTYCGGIQINGQAQATFEPGLYTIAGDVSIAGGATVTVDTTKPDPGVTFYIASGQWKMNGNSHVNLYAPTSGTYKGVLFYQDKSDTNQFTITGDSSSVWQGAFYLPAANLTLNGTGNVAAYTILDVNTLTVSGKADFNIKADYSSLSGGPPITASSVLAE